MSAVWTRLIAGLCAAACTAALAPAASASAGAGGAIAVQGWLSPEGLGPQSTGPRIAWVAPRTGAVRWQRLSDEIFPVSRSPDRGLVTFQRDGNLLVARTIGDRHARLVARRVRDAEWSPDGRRLAFIRGRDIRVTGPGLRGSRRVGAVGHASQGYGRSKSHRLVWSPDGKQIAFLRKVAPRGCATVGVGILRLTTGGVRTIYRPGTGPGACENAMDLAWSPAHRLVVATVDRDFISGDRDTHLRPMELGLGIGVFPPQDLTWLPGGRTLAYLTFGCVDIGPCRLTVRTVRADGSRQRSLASLPGRFGVVAMRWWP
jgi:hypothetical protein